MKKYDYIVAASASYYAPVDHSANDRPDLKPDKKYEWVPLGMEHGGIRYGTRERERTPGEIPYDVNNFVKHVTRGQHYGRYVGKYTDEIDYTRNREQHTKDLETLRDNPIHQIIVGRNSDIYINREHESTRIGNREIPTFLEYAANQGALFLTPEMKELVSSSYKNGTPPSTEEKNNFLACLPDLISKASVEVEPHGKTIVWNGRAVVKRRELNSILANIAKILNDSAYPIHSCLAEIGDIGYRFNTTMQGMRINKRIREQNNHETSSNLQTTAIAQPSVDNSHRSSIKLRDRSPDRIIAEHDSPPPTAKKRFR